MFKLQRNINDLLSAHTDPERLREGLELFENEGVLHASITRSVAEMRVANDEGRFETVVIRGVGTSVSATCTCRDFRPGLCPHAVAALLFRFRRECPDLFRGLPPEKPRTDVVPGNEREQTSSKPRPWRPFIRSAYEPRPRDVRLDVILLDGPPGRRSTESGLNVRCVITVEGRNCNGVSNLKRLASGDYGPDGLLLRDFDAAAQRIIRFLAETAERRNDHMAIEGRRVGAFLDVLCGHPDVYCTTSVPSWNHIVVTPYTVTPVLLARDTSSEGKLNFRFEIPGRGMLPGTFELLVLPGGRGAWVSCNGAYFRVTSDLDIAALERLCEDRPAMFSHAQAPSAQNVQIHGTAPVRCASERNSEELRIVRVTLEARVHVDVAGRDGVQAVLSFRYGDVVLPADLGEAVDFRGNVLILRDPRAERGLIQELMVNRGFRRTAPGVYRLAEDRWAVWKFLTQGLPDLRRRCRLTKSENFERFAAASGAARIDLESVPEKTDRRARGQIRFRMVLRGPGGATIPLPERAGDSGVPSALARPDVPGVLVLPDEAREKLGFVSRYGVPVNEDAGVYGIQRALIPAAHEMLRPAPERTPAEWRRIVSLLANPLSCADLPDFHPLTARLRDYQKAGVMWILRLQECGLNAVLADEMGLGKTVQALAVLAYRRMHLGVKTPSIIVCPSSLIDNWRREAARFVPELRVAAVRGPKRAEVAARLETEYDLVVTSYALLRRDATFYRDISFDCAVLDEAQHIKNPQTVSAQACKALNATHRIILTGTPVENHVGELWALFDFLEPELLPPSPRSGSDGTAMHAYVEEVRRIVRPFILRRTKKQVAPELPPKQEQVLYCELAPQQRRLYRRLLSQARVLLEQMREDPSGSLRMHVFALLTRLRQVCVHPGILPEDLRDGAGAENLESAKTDALEEIVLEAMDSGRRLLVFSQFTSFLKLFRRRLQTLGIASEYLDGATTDRQERVDRFNRDESIPVFLISLRAGGCGLNLTGADMVVHYDMWWNPMVEEQATDRTHRIGQVRRVNVIKLVARDTIEERILALQTRKRRLFDALIGSAPSSPGRLSLDDVEFLLQSR